MACSPCASKSPYIEVGALLNSPYSNTTKNTGRLSSIQGCEMQQKSISSNIAVDTNSLAASLFYWYLKH